MRKLELLGLSLVVLAMIFAPILLRAAAGAPLTPGLSSYDELRRAELLLDGSFDDPLRGTGIVPSPSTALLAGMIVFGVPWLYPGLLTVVLLFLISAYFLRRARDEHVVFYALLVIAASPTVSVLATAHGQLLFSLVALLFAVLFLDERPLLGGFALLLSAISVPVLGLVSGAYFLAIFLRRKRPMQALATVCALLVCVAWHLWWSGALPALPALSLSNPFLEFGNPSGISVFLVVLAVYGSILPDVPRRNQIALACAGLLLLAAFLPVFVGVSMIAFALLAGHGISHLIRNAWELELLRQSLLILVCCLGVFLVIVSIRERVAEMPTTDVTASLYHLQGSHRPGGVLSAPEYAPMIEYFAKRHATLLPTSSKDVLLSRDADRVYAFLDRTNTSYILITDEMREALFTRSDDGILFLLPNTKRFVLVEQTRTSEVWYYIPQ